MKLNCKGFMMAEVVVVSVIICTVLVTLYTALVRINNAYDTRNKYYDMNALYFTEEVNDVLIYNKIINKLIKEGNSKKVELDSLSLDYNNLNSVYGITSDGSIEVYFSPYDKDKVSALKNIVKTTTFKEYITYLEGHFNYNEDYEYMLITEMCKTKDDCYYYGVRVR